GGQGLLHHDAEVHGDRRLVAAQPHEVLDPLDRLGAAERRALDRGEPLAELGIGDALGQELRTADDGREDVVERVGERGGHLAEGPQLLTPTNFTGTLARSWPGAP